MATKRARVLASLLANLDHLGTRVARQPVEDADGRAAMRSLGEALGHMATAVEALAPNAYGNDLDTVDGGSAEDSAQLVDVPDTVGDGEHADQGMDVWYEHDTEAPRGRHHRIGFRT